MEVAILFGSFALFLILRVPIGISLGLSSLVAIMTSGVVQPTYLAQGLVTGADSFPLMAVPFFVLAGELMATGGISRRLLNIADAFLGRKYGGLALVTIVACMFFAAISGSGPATVAAIGGLTIPSMLKQGYDKNYSSAITAAAGSIGVIIPPSIPMVMYCVATGASVGALFMAGFIPGLLIGVSLCLYTTFYCKKHKYINKEALPFSWANVGRTLKDGVWALLVPVIILGGIYGGYFTPTEASVVAVVYGIIVSFCIYREITVKQFIRSLVDSAVAGSVILLMISTSMSFSWIFARQGLSRLIVSGVSSMFTTSVSFMILSFAIFLIFGTFMDANANALLLLPLMFPVAQSLGINAIHYCIFATGALIIGSSSPPVAVNIFTAVSVTGLPMSRIIKGMLPFFIMMILTVLIYSFFPDLSTFLPNLVG